MDDLQSRQIVNPQYTYKSNRFVVFLDYSQRSQFISLSNYIYWCRKYFHGTVMIEPSENKKDIPYIIDNPINPKKIYVLLPKEKIYVMTDDFSKKMVWSKIRELVYLFYCLRASYLTISYHNSYVVNTDHYHNLESQLQLYYVNIVNKTTLYSEDDPLQCEGVRYHLEFPNNYQKIDKNIFQNDFYHLHHTPEWNSLLYSRMYMNVIKDQYTYKNIVNKVMKRKLVKLLNKQNMDVQYDFDEYSDCFLKCEVYYCILNSLSS